MSRHKELDFSMQEYWDQKYAEKDTLFEWLEDYAELKPYIAEHIDKDAKIMMPGCGNSAISADMFNDGYKKIVNCDFSPVVIEQMSRRYADLEGMTWDVMDIKDLKYEDNSFDVVFDKGTLDALTCGEDVDEAMYKSCCEYVRVLKKGCTAYIVSFGQAVDRLEYFNPEREHPWIFDGYDLLPKERAPHCYYHVYKLRKPE